MTQGLLFFLPLLAIVVVLLTRRYPGERIVLALLERRTDRRPRLLASPRVAAPFRVRVGARGGELLGRSLAVRPPPRCSLAAG